MRNYIVGLVSVRKGSIMPIMSMTVVTALALCLLSATVRAETIFTPSLGLSAIQDDNVNFTGSDAEDDYIYAVEPGAKLDYNGELTQITADGTVLVRRYQDIDDLDDETYRFNLEGDTKFTERFSLQGRYKFIQDTTLDSELEEIGRIFVREDRTSHEALLAPSFNMTERTTIGLSGRYRNVEYDSDSDTNNRADYSVWDIKLPVWWRLATQIDSVYISPGYTYRESDTNRSKSYNVRLGWRHKTTERLNLNLSVGARYTEHERLITDGTREYWEETEENWGGLGALQFSYDFETGRFLFDFTHDLYNTAIGEQVNVSRVISRLQWNFTERLGMGVEGRYYYTQTEGQVDDDTTEYIEAGPDFFYNLTENHVIFAAYEYSQEDEKNNEDEPRAERNRIWAGIKFNFPI